MKFSTLVSAGPTALLAVSIMGCGAEESTPEPAPPEVVEIPRTGSITARGYTLDDFPRVQEVGDGVYTYEGIHAGTDERFTTVSLFVVTDEGVLVADGQGDVAQTRHLVETIAGITDQPITHVVMCSDHGDHTAGNSAFPTSASFIAHPTSKRALEATAANPNRSADAPAVVMPTELVSDAMTIELGGRSIEVQFLGRAHTGGDLHVYLPDDKILFMSEAYLNRIFPAMRSAYPSEWLTVIERAQAMDVDLYVPGHGFVETPAILAEELETYRKALDNVIAEAKRLHATGMSVDEAVEAADFGELGAWALASSQAPIAIRRTFMELNGELPSS